MVIDNDHQALYLAIGSAMHTRIENVKIARIRNTKDVEELWVSEPLWPELEATGRVTALGDFVEMPFDEAGMLTEFSAR